MTSYQPQRETRYDREKRQIDKDRLMRELREYLEKNNPPLLGDLKHRLRPLLGFGYAHLPELIDLVNVKIFPMKIMNIDTLNKNYQ